MFTVNDVKVGEAWNIRQINAFGKTVESNVVVGSLPRQTHIGTCIELHGFGNSCDVPVEGIEWLKKTSNPQQELANRKRFADNAANVARLLNRGKNAG